MRVFFIPQAENRDTRIQAHLPAPLAVQWLPDAARNCLLGLPGPYQVEFGCSYDGPQGEVSVVYQGPLNTTQDMRGLAREMVLLATSQEKAR